MPIVAKYYRAKRVSCKASVAIGGLSGRGKSGLALSMAYILAGKSWEPVRALDCENKSLNLYVGTPLHIGVTLNEDELAKADLTAKDGFKPSHYAAYRQAAIDEGALVWLADSFSHAWQYAGGILEMVSKAQQDNYKLNKWTAWGIPEVVAEKTAIMDLVRSPDIHTILTLRVKEKLEMIENEDGTKEMHSLGEQQITMPDFKYEPDLVLSMETAGDEDKAPVAKVEKSRYRIFKVGETYAFTANLLEQMRMYLDEGTNPAELLEMQRQDYLQAVRDFMDAKPNLKQIWKELKKDAGFDSTKLEDLPLPIIKKLYGQLVAE